MAARAKAASGRSLASAKAGAAFRTGPKGPRPLSQERPPSRGPRQRQEVEAVRRERPPSRGPRQRQEAETEQADPLGAGELSAKPLADDELPAASLPPAGSRIRFLYNQQEHQGIVGFAGPTEFAPGDWIGVIMDSPIGKNDGTVKDKTYFNCPPMHGLFIRVNMLLEAPESVAEIEDNRSLASTSASVVTPFSDGLPSSSSATSSAAPSERKPAEEEVTIETSPVECLQEPVLSLHPALAAERAETTAARAALAEARAEVFEARAEATARQQEAERAWGAMEAAGAHAKRSAQTSEEDRQVQAEQTQQLAALAVAMRWGREECLASLDAHCKRYELELAEAREACEVAKQRAAASTSSHLHVEACEEILRRDLASLEAASAAALSELESAWTARAEARIEDVEAECVASKQVLVMELAAEASASMEVRIEDIEAECAANKQALVVQLAEEASVSMEASLAETEEIIGASHQQMVREMEAHAASAREEAVSEAESRGVALLKEEQAQRLAMDQLLATRQALADCQQQFESAVETHRVEAEEQKSADALERQQVEVSLRAKAKGDTATALRNATELHQAEIALLEAQVSTSTTAAGRLKAQVQRMWEDHEEQRSAAALEWQEVEISLRAKAEGDTATALHRAAELHEAEIALLEAQVSTSSRQVGRLETQVQQMREDHEAQRHELDSASTECHDQLLQIKELAQEVAQHKTAKTPRRDAAVQLDGDLAFLMHRRSHTSWLDGGSSGGGLFGLTCCYRKPRVDNTQTTLALSPPAR